MTSADPHLGAVEYSPDTSNHAYPSGTGDQVSIRYGDLDIVASGNVNIEIPDNGFSNVSNNDLRIAADRHKTGNSRRNKDHKSASRSIKRKTAVNDFNNNPTSYSTPSYDYLAPYGVPTSNYNTTSYDSLAFDTPRAPTPTFSNYSLDTLSHNIPVHETSGYYDNTTLDTTSFPDDQNGFRSGISPSEIEDSKSSRRKGKSRHGGTSRITGNMSTNNKNADPKSTRRKTTDNDLYYEPYNEPITSPVSSYLIPSHSASEYGDLNYNTSRGYSSTTMDNSSVLRSQDDYTNENSLESAMEGIHLENPSKIPDEHRTRSHRHSKINTSMQPVSLDVNSSAQQIQIHNEIDNMSGFGSQRALYMKVEGLAVHARGDTGASQNIISYALYKKLRLSLSGKHETFTMGNCEFISSLGSVQITVTFIHRLSKTYTVTAHVIKDFSYDLVLGHPFLKATKTMKMHLHRFVRHIFHFPSHLLSKWRCFCWQLGRTSQRFQAILDEDIQIDGLPDSGSSRNFITHTFATRHGFQIDSSGENCGLVSFPKGPDEETLGRVYTTITFRDGKKVPIVFEVLRRCPVPVTLGEDFIFDNKIYAKYESSFINVDGDAEYMGMGYHQDLFKKTANKFKTLLTPNTSPEQDPGRSAASGEGAEYQRRQEWDEKFNWGHAAPVSEWREENCRRIAYEYSRNPTRTPPENEQLIYHLPQCSEN